MISWDFARSEFLEFGHSHFEVLIAVFSDL
jgi:hypothetical protein